MLDYIPRSTTITSCTSATSTTTYFFPMSHQYSTVGQHEVPDLIEQDGT